MMYKVLYQFQRVSVHLAFLPAAMRLLQIQPGSFECCHSPMLLSGIHKHQAIDSRLNLCPHVLSG